MEGPDRRLRAAARSRARNSDFDLIAEEAHKLPTTVGQRLACRLNLPWLNIDMDDIQRKEAGISGKSIDRRPAPLEEFDAPAGSSISYYLEYEDGAREQHWLTKVKAQKVNSAIIICGLMHVAPLSKKVQDLGWSVEELNVCEMPWFTSNFGTVKAVEENGQRYCEHRPPTTKSGVA